MLNIFGKIGRMIGNIMYPIHLKRFVASLKTPADVTTKLIRILCAHFLKSDRLTGTLTMIVLLSGLFSAHIGLANANSEITANWDNNFNGVYEVNGSDTYPARTAVHTSSKNATVNMTLAVTLNGTLIPAGTNIVRKKWFSNLGWPWNGEFDRWGQEVNLFAHFYTSRTVYGCGGKYCLYVRFIPNTEKLNKELKPGDVLVYTLNMTLAGESKSLPLTATFKRIAPLATIEPLVPKKYVVLDNSNHQVRLRLSDIPANPVTIQYQISTRTFFEANVIDRSIEVGAADANGEVPLERLLNIVDSKLTSSEDYENKISIRLIDSDGDNGPNGYRIPSGNIGNNLSMTIVDSTRLPTVRVARLFNQPASIDETQSEIRFEFVATHPTPIAEAIDVHYEVSQTGDFVAPTEIGKFSKKTTSTKSTTETLYHNITIIDDENYEPDGAVTVTVLEDQSTETPKYKVIKYQNEHFSPTASVNISSEDAKPVVSIVPPTGGSIKEGDDDGGFMVTATGRWVNEFTVNFTVIEQGGTSNFIETGSPTTLTFPPNKSENSVTRPFNPIHVDSTAETSNGTIMAALNPVTDDDHYTLGTPTTATATAEGNDPGVELSWSDGESGNITDSGSDNYDSISGTASVAFPSAGNLSLAIAARDSGMNTNDSDLEFTSSTEQGFSSEVSTKFGKWLWKTDDTGFKFEPNTDAINQLVDGDSESSTLHAKFRNSSGEFSHATSITVSITGATIPVRLVSIDDVTAVEGTGSTGTRFRFTVSLSSSSALNQSFTVPVTFAHGTTDSDDFFGGTDPSALNATFGPTDTKQYIDIMVAADADTEYDETFILTLSEPTGDAKNMNLVTLNNKLGSNVGTGTITGDDGAIVSIDDVTSVEGTSNTSNLFLFTVSLSPAVALNHSFTVPVTFAHVTTTSDDFLGSADPTSLDVTFKPADISKSIYIKINEDAEVESDETFTLTLSEPTGDAKDMNLILLSNVPDATVGTGTIANDDLVRSGCSQVICMNWDAEFHGNMTFDGISIYPRYMVGKVSASYPVPHVTVNRDDAFERKGEELLNSLVQTTPNEGSIWTDKINDSEYPGFNGISPDASLEKIWAKDFTYGSWYRKGNRNCPEGVCFDILFLPNKENIKKLPAGVVVTSTYKLRGELNGTLVDTKSISVTISSVAKKNHIGFNLASRNALVLESRDVTLSITASSPVNEAVTVPFTITDGSAVLDSDYTSPAATSVTIEAGQTTGTITIPTSQDTVVEPTGENFTVSLGDGTNYIVSPSARVATVTIIDDDEPIVGTIGQSTCSGVSQPGSVTTPIELHWDTSDLKVYYAAAENHFFVGMGTVTANKDFKFGAYFRNGTPENENIPGRATTGSTSEGVRIGRPGMHRGHFRYKILPSCATDSNWYKVGSPSEFSVWWTDEDRPGITLSIERDSVHEGKQFRVVATATPEPNRDILVPVTVSDISRIVGAQNFDIIIKAGQKTGYRDVSTKFQTGDQTEDDVTVSTVWSSIYWLDDSVKSDSVSIVDHEKAIVGFKSSDPDIEVSESGTAQLTVKMRETRSTDTTVKYRIDDVDTTVSDFVASSSTEITIAAGKTEETISIQIAQDSAYEETESFTVTLLDGVNANEALADNSNDVATVFILSVEPPTITPVRGSCDDVTQPSTVQTPNTQVYWKLPLPYVYQEIESSFTARMGFRDPATQQTNSPIPAQFRYGAYYANGNAQDDSYSENSEANAKYHDFEIQYLDDHKGYLYYRIEPSRSDGSEWYNIGMPCEFHVWWTDGNKPGISLSVNRKNVEEGEEIVVTATATPRPSHDLTVPFTFSDATRIAGSQAFELTIEKNQPSGSRTIQTTSLPGDQPNDGVTVSVPYRSSYWLDESEQSDAFTFTERADVATVSIDDVELVEGNGTGNTTFRFSVSLTPATALGQSFKVPLAFDQGSTDSADFINDVLPSVPAELDFTADATSVPVEVTVSRDDVVETDESFTLTLSEPTGPAKDMGLVMLSSVQDATVGTGTITNDDFATVSIASVVKAEGTGTGSTRFEFAVRLSPAEALGQTFSVPVAFNHVSTDTGDFMTGQDLNSLSANFGINDTEGVVSVEIGWDGVNEPDESFTLTLLEPTGNAKSMNLVALSSVQAETVATGTITNDDQTRIGIDNVTRAEGNGSGNTLFEFKVSLSPAEALSQDFSVPVTFKHVTTDKDDFADGSLANLPSSVDFTAGKTSVAIEVMVSPDIAGELDETFTLTLAEPTGAAKDMNLVRLSATQSVGMGTITTDDGAVVGIGNAMLEENSGTNGSTLFQFTLNLHPAAALGQEFSVPVTFAHGTTDDADFVTADLASLPPVPFAAGKTSATIDIVVGWDDDNEGDETFTLTIAEPTGPAKVQNLVTLNSTPGGNVGTGTIQNDDQATLSIDSVVHEEGTGTGSTMYEFTVSLSPPEALSEDFEVPVSFKHGTTNNADFVSSSLASFPAKVNFGAADTKTSATVGILVNWDDDLEGDETFTLILAEPTGEAKDLNLVQLSRVQGANVGTGTITGDDQPVIDFPAEAYVHEGAGEAQIVLTVTGALAKDISLTASIVAISDPGVENNLKAEPGADFTAISDSTLTIPANSRQAVLKIQIVNDTDPEENERFRVEITKSTDTGSSNAYDLDRSYVDVVIIDDDTSPVVEIYAASQTVAEGDSAVFTVSTSYHDDSAGDVVVDLLLTQTGDYLAWGQRKLRVSVGRTATVSLATLDNETEDGGGTVTAAISQGTGYALHPGGEDYTSATVTFVDNDSPTPTSPKISVVSAVITQILLEIPDTEPGGFKSNLNLPVVSISAIESNVKEGDPIRIAVSVDGDNETVITVSIGLMETGDYIDEDVPVNVAIPAGSNTAIHEIPTVDDDLSEPDGIVTAFILKSDEYSLGDPSTVEIRVTDEEDRLARRTQVSEASLSMLPEITGSIGARSLGTMSIRMSQAFSDSTGPELELGGGTTLKEMLTSGAKSFDEGSVSWEEVLGDSSFKLDLLPEVNGASTATIWGLGDFRGLTGGGTSFANTSEGNVFTGHIGIDSRIGEGIVSGFTTSIASAEASYGQGNGRIQLQTRTTGVHPYVGLRSADGDGQLDVIAGYGLGEIGLDQVRYSSEMLQSSYYNVGLKGSSQLYSDEGLFGGSGSISVTGDSWLARLFLKNEDGFVEGSRTKAGYARMAIEGRQEYGLTNGDKFHAESRLGVGADEKGDLSFFGMLLETGLGYQNPFGLTLEGDSNVVATNGGQVRELAISGGMSFDRNRDNRGLILKMFREWGREFSKTDKPLWRDQLLNSMAAGTGAEDARISAEVSYGLQLSDYMSLVTPKASFLLSDGNSQYGMGIRLNNSKTFDFELESLRQFANASATEHIHKLSGNVRW